MSEEIDDQAYAALAGFRFELRQFQTFSEQAARAAGLTAQQHQALLAIRANGSGAMLIGDLAERLLLKPHSTSELVDRLAEHGLVVRQPGAADRRQVRVQLTDHAREILASLSASHLAELRRLRPLLQRWLSLL